MTDPGSGTGRRRGAPADEGRRGAPADEARRGAPADEEAYQTEEFSFVDDADPEDVIDWLTFVETRSERREERRRRARVRMRVGLVLLLVVAMTAGGLVLWNRLHGGTDAGAAGRTAVLFQVHGLKGDALASALLVRGTGDDGGRVLVLPAGLTLEAPGHEPTRLSAAPDALGPSLTRDALSDMLGVPVDGSWELEEVAFASLVDQLGGIDTDVDVDVKKGGAVVVKAGRHRLDGNAALAYGTYQVGRTGAQKASERFERVLTALLTKLPTDVDDAGHMLDNLGVIPDPALPNERLAAALAGLAADTDAKQVQYAALPIRSDGLLDARGAGPLVHRLLGGAVRKARDTGPARVLVEDGTGRTGAKAKALRTAVSAKLLGGGYRYIDGGKADQRVHTTVVQVPDDSEQVRRGGEQVALTLGLSPSAVKVINADEIAADVVVIVGDDFVP